MAKYELPDDVPNLSDDDLAANIAAARRAFKNLAATTTVTASTIPDLEAIKAAIDTLVGEQADRTAAAEAAAARIDQLAAEVLGEPEAAPAVEVEVQASADTEPETEPEAAEPEVIEPTAVVTAAARKSLNLTAVRSRQASGPNLSRYTSTETRSEIELTAAVDVPGFRPGQEVDLSDVTEAVIRRAQVLQTAGGGVGMVASYKLPFPQELTVNDASSAPEGSLATLKAADQSRLEGGDLVASGGWCAPSETIYSFTERSCPDMLWDLPEIQLNRGGIRFFREPVLDVNALTWVHTEADDIAGTTKPCYVIPCATPTDVRAEAQGVCLQYGILTARFFPELIDMYVRQSMVAHEIRMKTRAYELARTAATAVTIPATFAAFSAVYAAVALQVADMTERYNLCASTNLEVVFPWWTRNLFMADIARQQGVKPEDLDPNIMVQAFAKLGVSAQWARGLAPDVPTNLGNATPATAWPADMEFLIHEAGGFQLGRGPEVNLGVVIDTVTMATNDAKQFSEEAVALIDRAGTARRVTVPICPTGTVGAVPTTSIACPVA